MRFGILGWGKIARTQLAPAIAQAGHEVVAIGSRSPTATTLAWSEAHAPVRWTSYEGVLSDPRVEAVYIAESQSLAPGAPMLALRKAS